MSYFRPVQAPKIQRQTNIPGYRYREYAPCDKLAPYVACYWTVDFHTGQENHLHRIIPDGCVDIILDRLSPTAWKASFIEGIMTQYEVIPLQKTQSMFGIRFFIESAKAFFTYPVSEFMGHRVYLEEIWGREGVYFVEELLAETSVDHLIEKVERRLLFMLSCHDPYDHPLIHASLQYIYLSKGQLSIAQLADQLCYSERQVRRCFDRELGISPKEMAGIVRFQSMLQEMYVAPFSSMTDIALKYGYYDQSHFIKNFKRYYGLLPGQLWKTD